MSHKIQSGSNILHSSNKDRQYDDQEEESPSNYLDIWDKNPSYKDINLKIVTIKIIFSTVFLFLAATTFMLTFNLFFSLGLSIFMCIMFILAFSDNFFNCKKLWARISRKYVPITPFKEFDFWKMQADPATILIINKKDSTSTAVRIFKVETLPENVYPTLNQFLKALNKAKIPYTYQVVQTPVFDLSENLIEDRFQTEVIRNQKLNSLNSFQTVIYFSVYYSINGILTNTRLKTLTETVQDISNEFKSNFSANFHHTKATLLMENDLINAIRTYYYKTSTQPEPKELDDFITNGNILKKLIKIFTISFLIAYLSIILIIFNFPLYLVIVINLLVEIAVIFIWWRDILYSFSKKLISRSTEITTINPFADVKFFRIKGINNVIFAHIDNILLLATKIFNLYSASQPTLTYFDKFIRGIENHKISFNYNLQTFPVSIDPFPRECSKAFNEKTSESLEGILFHPLDKRNVKYVKHPKLEFEKWLDMRSGIWNTMLTLSNTSHLFVSDLDLKDFIELNKELSVKSKVLKGTFEDNFLNYKLAELTNQSLLSGYLSECFKNHNFRLNGSHLNYIYFQGKNLMELVKIVNEFKKGIDTRIAAEFNTPFQLTNFISIGNTINTEFLEEEIPLGFTYDQVKQLLITNGSTPFRELAKMKMAVELIKSNIPCVIFDYNGQWTKLIQFFANTRYQERILHFKLGSSFNIDIKNSGIKYDQHNVEYLNLFYDVFALAFKEQKRNIDMLKDTISKNDNLDLPSITLDLETKPEWEKRFSNSLLLFFKDFTSQGRIFSKTALDYEDDVNPVDFIKTEKTVILDLSILKDLEKKTFIAFIIISKFIHLVENSENYHKKIIFVPHIDLFFDSYYIDTNYGTVNYGKIDKFIEPLFQRGFGFIFSANQIRYLHPHVFNHFPNVVTFRANDKRDIAVLKNRMNLQELHGTGYYSSKRNNTYQIDYLMNMLNDEIIVKRSDIYQPFPGRIDFDNLHKTHLLTHDQIINFMEKQGYKLGLSEKKLLNKARKTIFEKDFGMYATFIDEIIHFLKQISSIENVAGLYRHKLKEELLIYVKPKASRMVQNNNKIKEIRDQLLKILIKQGYLIENHPRRASGSEAMRTSYAVGPQYQKAVQDYFETKTEIPSEISVDVIEKNNPIDSKLQNLFQNNMNKGLINKDNFEKALLEAVSESYYNLFKVYRFNNNRDYINSLKVGKTIISEFLKNLYTSYIQINEGLAPELEDINLFLDFLVKENLVPFSKTELQKYIRKSQEYNYKKDSLEQNADNLYNMISEFIAKFNLF